VKGDKLGRMLGFPTANLQIDAEDKLIPAHGIYAVTASLGQQLFRGMLYIGNRPTIDGSKTNIEVNLFDFDRDIYGETLQVNIIASLRKDARFDDLETLKRQLHTDKTEALKALSQRGL
jgi:riboflavin kinase/FMN adenylyltransferase